MDTAACVEVEGKELLNILQKFQKSFSDNTHDNMQGVT